jgi:putative inorganic carbon (HCO3(-)) transporter
MRGSQKHFQRIAFYLTLASLASALFSIAVCHATLALATAALLASGERLRLPPVKLPLAVFLGLTLVSLALSPDPGAGRPQIRKFFVFLTLLVVASLLRRLEHANLVVLLWAGVGTLSSVAALVQFQRKLEAARAAGAPFYEYYVGERITGFMSHWMTFAGEMTVVLLMLASMLFFYRGPRAHRAALAVCGATIALAIVASFTRSVWPATAAGGVYLLWHWRRWAILALPLIAAAGFWMAPAPLRERVLSAWRPKGELDSNRHRAVLRATGWRMIQSHPLFGVGPMMVEKRFDEFLPPGVEKPVPSAWWYGHLHNFYLHYAAERGVPAMLALLWLIGKALWDFSRARARDGPSAFVLRGAVAVIVAVLVGGLWEHNLGDSEVLQMFLAVICLGYNTIEESNA